MNSRFIVLNVAPNFPLDSIKANVMYIFSTSSSYSEDADKESVTLFVNNGNIYLYFRRFNNKNISNNMEIRMCCSITRLKRFVASENIKKFIIQHGRKKQLETIADLYKAVFKCGYAREIERDEYYEAESNLKSDFSERCKFDDLNFTTKALSARSHPGDALVTQSRWGSTIIFDMISNRRKQQIPNCIKDEILHWANKLMEENLLTFKDVRFLLHAEIELEVLGSLSKRYKVRIIMIDKNGEQLSKKDFCLCDCTKEMEDAMEKYFKEELFS